MVSLCLHLGLVVAAYAVLTQAPPDDLPPGGEVPISVEIVSAVEQSAPDLPIPDVPLPEPLAPVTEQALLPVPDIPTPAGRGNYRHRGSSSRTAADAAASAGKPKTLAGKARA